MSRHPLRRLAAGLATTAIAASTIALAPPAAPAVAADPAPVPTTTITPDPSYRGPAFEGWGTSLVWFANATGDYPDEVRNRLADLVFGKNGLDLNIARYNVGGGNAPDVPDYLRPGGAVEGWWNAPAGTTRTDTDWWDPEDPADWNDDADRTQRWWIDRIKERITHWEAFSNSPPWFQTVSGYVSGGFNASSDQIRADRVDDFAAYLVGVVERLERAHGIHVDTIDPLNEPNTSYWGTQLGSDGNPTGGRQEGAHVGPALQQQVIRALGRRLAATGSDARISAMDETNPGTFLTDWNSYADDTRALVDQLNVHTYGTSQRTAVRDIAKGEDKPLWMSEVEGSWGNGQSFTDMAPGLGMAQRITDDLRELEPSAWVFWQPVEDYDNMKPGGESAAGANWGSIQLPFDCTATDTLQSCPIYTNTKFDTVRNYTHFIRPGDHLIGTDNANSTAAITDTGVTVVHVNDSTSPRDVVLDLSDFGRVANGARVVPVTSSADGALVRGTPVAVSGDTATLRVPPRSVTTFVIDGVSGVAPDAALVQPGHVYRLQGVQSTKSLAPAATGSGLAIRTTSQTSTDQLWSLTRLSGGDSNRARYSLSTAAGDRQVANVAGTPALVPAQTTPDANAQFVLSTTGDGTYTLVNAATRRLLEVGGQSTADGAPVDFWLSNAGDNQRWRIADETVLGAGHVDVFTPTGVAPELPATVPAARRDGERGSLPVTWEQLPASTWDSAGTVEVAGTATDALGRSHAATATVTVDRLVSTRTTRAKTFVGEAPSLPATVKAVGGTTGVVVDRPVTWEETSDDAFDAVGVVTLHGSADAGDGRTLPATVRVQVTEPTEENAALAPGTTLSATFTEPGYSTAGLRNGSLTDKAWSNWRSGTKNPSDTITVTLPTRRTVTHVVSAFYRDGGDTYAQSLRVQARRSDGTWADAADPVSVPAGSPAPTVDVPIQPTRTDAVRVVLTARPNTHITMSEIQVMARTAGVGDDARAASITVDGTEVPGFDADTAAYEVEAPGHALVAAEAVDPYATVSVEQPAPGSRTATVTVTSEDGTTTRTYTVRLLRLSQTITFGPLADMTVGDPDVSLTATASSGLPVEYDTSGPCEVSGSRLHATAAGTCSVTASQPGDDDHRPAASVTRTLEVTNPVLDDFDRSTGGLGSHWDGSTGEQFYRVSQDVLRPRAGGPAVHADRSFGTSQEAFVTLDRVDPKSKTQGVLLKAQPGELPGAGAIAVVYDAKADAVQVATWRPAQPEWTTYRAVGATYHDGDTLTAQVGADGTVTVLRNDTVVATVPLNAADRAFFDSRGGRIGIWSRAARDAAFDDFGGGSLG